MSIEELATLLGEQIMAEKADAWDECADTLWNDGWVLELKAHNPYRNLVSA